MSPKLRNLYVTMALLFTGLSVYGQEIIDGGGTPPPPPPPAGPPLPGLVVPIDENIIVLVLSGFVIGVYYYIKNRVKHTS